MSSESVKKLLVEKSATLLRMAASAENLPELLEKRFNENGSK